MDLATAEPPLPHPPCFHHHPLAVAGSEISKTSTCKIEDDEVKKCVIELKNVQILL